MMADPTRRPKDYNSQIRKRLANSSRTGQACDRCKLRKIRCDPDPNGCAGCRAASESCETTDRITRKAQRRGHSDLLENENAYLKGKLQEYQQRLIELGVSPSDLRNDIPSSGREGSQQLELLSQSSTGPYDGERRDSLPRAQTSLWQKHFNNIAGNLPSNPAFSMLRGTKLSLFHTEIDLAEFAEHSTDIDSPQTFNGFVHFANTSNAHLPPPPLPPTLKDAQLYLDWFFNLLSPYVPILGRRQMHTLVQEVYKDMRPGPRPGRTAAEEVMVHMLFSYTKYQYGQRNRLQHLIDEAMNHFKYALGFTQNLMRGQSLLDVQAMGIITLQLRTFTTPSASWLCAQLTVNLAVECGLNRSVDSLPATERQHQDVETIETRKRVFWSLYGLACGLCIRLGRPVPLRLSDIDIEFPSPVHDYLPGEEKTMTDFQKCSFRVGIVIAQLFALMSELCTTFYTVSSPPAAKHEKLVAKFRADLEMWQNNVPEDIADSLRAKSELAIYAMYVELYEAEFRFLLYHPLLHPPNQAESYRRSNSYCLKAIADTAAILMRLRDAKCLDVPWHATTMLLAMIFTQLFIEDQRSAEVSEADIQKLQADMNVWLDIFGTFGEMLGSGKRLQNSIVQIMRKVLEKLENSVKANSVGNVIPTTLPQHGPPPHDLYSPTGGYGAVGQPSAGAISETHSYPSQAVHTMPGPGKPYPASSAQASFPPYDANPASRGMYPTTALTYNPAPYITTQGKLNDPPMQAPMVSVTTQPSYSAPIGYYTSPTVNTTPANEWLRWSQANNPFTNPIQPEYMTSTTANTLLTMGSRNPSVQSNPAAVHDESNQWPTNIYNINHFNTNPPG